MPTIDATVGGASSNSYLTEAEVVTMADERLDAAEITGPLTDDMKRAQFELMLALLKGTYSIEDSGLESLDSMNIGPVNLTPRNRAADALPSNVQRYLQDFVPGGSGAVIVRS